MGELTTMNQNEVDGIDQHVRMVSAISIPEEYVVATEERIVRRMGEVLGANLRRHVVVTVWWTMVLYAMMINAQTIPYIVPLHRLAGSFVRTKFKQTMVRSCCGVTAPMGCGHFLRESLWTRSLRGSPVVCQHSPLGGQPRRNPGKSCYDRCSTPWSEFVV